MISGGNPFDAAARKLEESGVIDPAPKKRRRKSGGDNSGKAFDPAAAVERFGLWWLNGSSSYFLPDTVNGQSGWLEMGPDQLRRLFGNYGVHPRRRDGETLSEFDRLLAETMLTRAVDYAASIAGREADVYDIQGARVLVRSSPRLVKPLAGDYSIITDFLEALLGGDDGTQVHHLLGWLKVALESLYSGELRSGQCLILVGPGDCGKSRLQHNLITPLLGGRSADPKSYFFGRTDFNSELIGSEHLLIEEIPNSSRFDDREYFGEKIKEIVANDSHRLHKKTRDAVSVSGLWRLSISLNPSKINILPAITPDMRDKLILLQARACAEFYERFADAPDPRAAFRKAIERSLPGFVHDLLNHWTIPASIQSRRFGVREYLHPELSDSLFEQERESLLLLLIDKELFRITPVTWEGDMEDLKEALTGDESLVAASAKRITSDLGTLGLLMKKLAIQVPDRIEQMPRSNHKRLWRITPPRR